MFGSPMRVDTVPPVALEDVIALWADARWFSFELSLAAKTGLLHSDLLKLPTSALTGDRRRGPERSEGPPPGVCVERPVRLQRTHGDIYAHPAASASRNHRMAC